MTLTNDSNTHMCCTVVAAAYAIGKHYYTEESMNWEILSAERQVVSGLMYAIVIKTIFSDKTYEITKYKVWDHFGVYSVTDTSIVQGRTPIDC